MSKLSGIPVTRLVICDVYQHGIYQILPDAKNVSEIRPEDVTAAYEVDPYTSTTIHAVTGHCYISDRSEMAFDDENAAEMHSGKTLFGQPFITSFPHDLTCRQVWDHIWWQVRRMVLPLLSRMEDSSTGSPNEDTLKSMLQIRFVDQNGNPRSIVKPKGMDESIRNDMAELSLLPRESNESIISFLGSDCTERFLFLSLEWSDDIPNCNGPKLEFDEFMTMADHGSFIDAVNRIKSLKSKTGVTLDDCFQTFTRPERLDEDNMWYCSNCKEHVRAMKTMDLWQLPNVLILHLKRFEFKHALRRDKLETFVDSPLSDLDMTKYCASYHHAAQDNDFVVDQVPAMYDLFGVTNHYGRMGFGHYTAHARRWSEDDICHEWATFDDSSVHSAGDGTMSNNQVVTPAAYILFYRRRIFS
jgi:ubiquitin carboxyl-terminal hydrolase 4/11/15